MQTETDFYPRPPRGGRRQRSAAGVCVLEFLSTPSARRATYHPGALRLHKTISIHALREEGDFLRKSCISPERTFLSTPSARRATRLPSGLSEPFHISIHALREEGDGQASGLFRPSRYFYPRPPRGGRRSSVRTFSPFSLFLSTPSARRATRLFNGPPEPFHISIHALREEGDNGTYTTILRDEPFLSTPSARRATAKTETKSLFSYKLYNILHGFRRALIYNGSKNYPNHAK